MVLLIVPLQVIVIHRFSVGGVVPDTMLVAVCFVGLWRGTLEAVLLGVVFGVLQDLLSGAMVWVHLMTKPLIGFVSGIVGRMSVSKMPWVAPTFVMGASLVAGLLILFLLKARSSEMAVVQVLLGTILPQMLFDGMCGVIVVMSVSCLSSVSYRRGWNQ